MNGKVKAYVLGPADTIYRWTTPRRAAPLLSPRPRAANRLIPKQLRRKPANLPVPVIDLARSYGYQTQAHLKNATREIERSSSAERDDANIVRRTAGVTGKRLFDGECGGWLATGIPVTVDDVEERGGMKWDGRRLR
jgi:hypothetical protein